MHPMLSALLSDPAADLAAHLACLSLAMAKWRDQSQDISDQDAIECTEYVLDALADADRVRRIELHTGQNVRDQISVDDTLYIAAEAELRKMGHRRN